jgi:hypothetical protein
MYIAIHYCTRGFLKPRHQRRSRDRQRALRGAAISQFHDAAETTAGTIQGKSRRTLNNPPAGILVRSNSASANPISELPNTPVNVNTRVKRAASQKPALRNGDLIDAGRVRGVGELHPRVDQGRRPVPAEPLALPRWIWSECSGMVCLVRRERCSPRVEGGIGLIGHQPV